MLTSGLPVVYYQKDLNIIQLDIENLQYTFVYINNIGTAGKLRWL